MSFPKEVKTQYEIRFSDCDPYGHLNNAKYLEYFHNARQDHLKNIYHYNLKEYIQSGLGFVVGSQQIFYYRPAQCYEMVNIQTSLIRMDDFRITIEFIMLNENEKEIKSIMWTEYWGINISTGKQAAIPENRNDFFNQVINNSVDFSAGINSRYKTLKESILSK